MLFEAPGETELRPPISMLAWATSTNTSSESAMTIQCTSSTSLRYLQHSVLRASLKKAAMQPHIRCSILPTFDLYSERHRLTWLNRIEVNTNG